MFNVLLQILDDGRMTDGHGRTGDFKNSIIIMTSNVGSQWIQDLGGSQPQKMADRVLEALKSQFKPEFLNRIDEIIIFHNLTKEQIGKIVEIQIDKLRQRLADKQIDLVLSDRAKAFLAEKGYDPSYGARPLKRVVQKYIENELSLEILTGSIHEGDRLKADVQNGRIVFTTT